MTRTKYPPLPTFTRPMVWLVRTLGFVIAVAGLFVAGLAVRAGRGDLAASVVALGFCFSAFTWIHPLSRWFSPTWPS